MNSDARGTAEAKAILDRLPDIYFAVLKNTYIEQPTQAEVRCTFELPVLGKRTKTAPSTREAIRAVLKDLAELLTEMPIDQWPKGWRDFASNVQPAYAAVQAHAKGQRFQAKARQFTIGVTMPTRLKASLDGLADKREVSFAEVARRLAASGFEDFDSRCFSEGTDELLSLLSSEVGNVRPSESEQVMVRVEPQLAVRMRAAAKEYRRSASEFGAMCLAHGLVLHTQFVELENKVAAYRGPAARTLAPKVGLGGHAALLSGVIAGSIAVPTKVLSRLSHVLGASEASLKAFFRRSFQDRAVPAFKADNGKPHVAQAVTPWRQAVTSLGVPEDQAKKLLQLDD